ncbi:MAG: glycosyltransferase family 2 protein [Nitrospirae bacterium]|nr:glycosyltransferase family 2 protein [Nitrospirota bacterium]
MGKDHGSLKHVLISVVIVNWNGKYLLGECLDSLLAQSVGGVEIILVDNGSQDGSAEYVLERYRDVRVVSLPENIGFAGGNNAGIRIASGKYIALLNNDTRVDPEWIPNLLKEAEAGPANVGMWASKILSYDNPNIIDNVGLLLYPDGLGRGKGRMEKDEGQYDQTGEAFFPSGCAGLYRREMLDEVGLFDEEFFAYADDVDLGLRARLAGWQCIYVPSAKVYHKYSASSSAHSPFKAFLVERNRIWVLLKYYPMEMILISPLGTLTRLLFHLYGALAGKGASGRFTEQRSIFDAMAVLLKAWYSALSALPGIIRQRRAFSTVRKIGRRELYRLFCKFRISAYEIALKE